MYSLQEGYHIRSRTKQKMGYSCQLLEKKTEPGTSVTVADLSGIYE